MQFDKGARVMTPHGPGEVVSKRMKGPDYTEVAAYCVCLDSKKGQGTYTGTAYLAEQVGRICNDPRHAIPCTYDTCHACQDECEVHG